ncbi:MAG: 23S rRNA (adenine(2503)-C(2))-methyltransferase RlmN [Odoribacter sp.]|nr:23S rRNA (adenine(2503)-C(2))-methyltransferase RlmN [Odoribacter sp.]
MFLYCFITLILKYIFAEENQEKVEKKNIRNLEEAEIISFLKEKGEKPFRSKQIMEWIWKKGVTDFEEMTNLSKPVRELLAQNFYFDSPHIKSVQTSVDGTTKYAWELADGKAVESVLIPGNNKYTVCVSSQAGCQLGCKFCATGMLGFKRNLSAGEIFDQVMHAQKEAENREKTLSNIVFMGMGEPLLNYEEVMKAIQRLTDPKDLNISPYRITVSTAGLADQIKQLADEDVKFNLAISLHSAKDEIRNSLMPINKKFPLAVLADSLKYFVEKTGTRPTFEYLLLKGINNSLEDARALALYCRQFPVKINIIEYNSTDNSTYQTTSEKQRDSFMNYLLSKNMIVNLRRSKGKDIDAACGQLANKM